MVSRKAKTQLKCKKEEIHLCSMEKVLWLIECVKSGLWSFVLEISPCTMLYGQWGRPVEVVSNQIETLRTIKVLPCRRSAHILRISKSIKLLVKVKNVFCFMEKNKWTFWPTQYNWGLDIISREERPGKDRLPWGEVLISPVLSLPGTSARVTICAWP